MYTMMTQGVPKIAGIRRLSQYVINRELRKERTTPPYHSCRLICQVPSATP